LDVAADELWLSPVSVWELALLHERSRVRLANGPRAWVDDALQRLPLKEAPLIREVALISQEIALSHRDPADRFLAATALVYELTLVTVDRRLTGASWLSTRSG
jgi:PIN domain nuclease of toxin-antitoxin system